MAREPQYLLLVNYLRDKGGQATIREIHIDTWINNVPDAAMQARRKGYDIETIKDPANPKIASYVLREALIEKSESKTVTVPEGGAKVKVQVLPDFDVTVEPPKQRAYHE